MPDAVAVSPTDHPAGLPPAMIMASANVCVVTNAIRAIDAQSGVEVWRSPAFPGTTNLNSLQYVDVNGDGKKEISFATSNGMFYTR
jgi:hypothetical protein